MSAQATRQTGALRVRSAPSLRRVEIEWGVSRRALGERAPAGGSALLTLRYQGDVGGDERWELIDPGSGASVAVAPMGHAGASVPEIRSSGGCVHVHSPTIYAFISSEHDRPELLYARTPMFASLRVGGGRYQPQGVRLRTSS